MKEYIFHDINELKEIIANIKLGETQYYIIKNSMGDVIEYDFNTNIGKKLHNNIPDKFINPFYKDQNITNEDEESSDTPINSEESIEEVNTESVDTSTEDDVNYKDEYENLENLYSDLHNEYSKLKTEYDALKIRYDELSSQDFNTDELVDKLKSKGYSVTLSR